ncbi:hypothetical protein RDV16_005148 [Salmonella enterica]|nr:hypothetical protein [Salmonella enterica]
MSENTINKALRLTGYDTKQQDICGHGFRVMVCSDLMASGLRSQDEMSHPERNTV